MGDAASMPAELAAVRNARRLMLGSFMERGWSGCGGTLLVESLLVECLEVMPKPTLDDLGST